MRLTKEHLCHLPFCYAVGAVKTEGCTKYIFATDDSGPCYAIDAETGEWEVVWEGPGGTMSIVPLPGRDGEFLASQNFLPGFSAARARIVRVSRRLGRWQVEPWLELPYVHRFDILERGGVFYFLGCILSDTREERAQWDVPGTLTAAPLSPGFAPPDHLETIAGGMFRNHGYCRVRRTGYTQAYTACDQGVFQITPPPASSGLWEVRQLLDTPASDVAVCDIDGDGQEELAVIAPFHGDTFSIYHTAGSEYVEMYRYPKPLPFLHAVWGGTLGGRPAFLAGCRGGDREFFRIGFSDGLLKPQIIEAGFGPSNVAVLSEQGRDVILTANRESHEGALFTIQEVE